MCVCVCVCVCLRLCVCVRGNGAQGRQAISVYKYEEHTCMSYEEEHTCISFQEAGYIGVHILLLLGLV